MPDACLRQVWKIYRVWGQKGVLQLGNPTTPQASQEPPLPSLLLVTRWLMLASRIKPRHCIQGGLHLAVGSGLRSEPWLSSCSCRQCPAQQAHQHPTAGIAAPCPNCPQRLPGSLMCLLQVVRGRMPLIHSITRQEASR